MMYKAIKKLLTSATAKDAGVLFVGSFSSNVFAIAFTILFGRLLGPENLAVGTAFIGLVAILNAIGDLGLGSSLFRYVSGYLNKSKEKAQKVLQGIFVVRVRTAIIFLLLLVIVSPLLANILLKIDSPTIAVFVGIAVAGYLVFDFQVQVFQAHKDFGKSSILLVGNNLLRLILLIVFYNLGVLTLVSGIVIFSLSSFICYILSLHWHRVKLTNDPSWKNEVANLKSFSGWMGVNRTFGAIGGRVDTLILLQYLTKYEAGIFSAARQLSFGVPVLIGSFATVLAPRFASLRGENLKNYLVKSIGLSIIVSLGLALGIIIAPWVINLYGDEFAQSTKILQLLLAGYIPFVLSTPAVNLIIYAFGKPKIITIMTIIQLPVVFLGIIFLAPQFGYFAPVIMNFVVNFSMFFVAYYFAFTYLNHRDYQNEK